MVYGCDAKNRLNNFLFHFKLVEVFKLFQIYMVDCSFPKCEYNSYTLQTLLYAKELNVLLLVDEPRENSKTIWKLVFWN